jgi:diacylglycerol kinase
MQDKLDPLNPYRDHGLWRHFRYVGRGWAGITYAIRDGRRIGYQIPGAVIALKLGIVREASPEEWACLVISVTTLFVAKMVNTMAERICEVVLERTTGNAHTYDKNVGRIKDMGSGLVFVSILSALVIDTIILVWPG